MLPTGAFDGCLLNAPGCAAVDCGGGDLSALHEESPALLGNQVAAKKQSSVLTTVYNMSRRKRHVDREEVSRLVGLMA